MINETKIKCIETFVSWQGEGNDCGKRMLIVRFKTCNRIESGKKCPWCDTAVKLKISMEYSISINEIQEVLDREKCGILITGGCPTFLNNFDQTLLMLNNLNYNIANVESNGHRLYEIIQKVDPNKKVNYSYSPKIFTEKELQEEIEKSKKLSEIPNVFFKIVYEERDVIERYLEYIESFNINDRIFLMPKGVDKNEIIKNASKVFDIAEKYRFNFSSRDHVIYGFV